jgi:nucleoredoxin
MANNGGTHDLFSLLSSPDRDFLVSNNGNQVKISELNGKTVGLYFSGSWCGPCRMFTPKLIEVYEQLSSETNFEVVFISSDRDEKSFTEYFSKMPWLSVPYSDLENRKRIKELFKVRGIPNLVFLDGTGAVGSDQGVRLIREHGVEAYPFSMEKINLLKEQEEEAKRNQSLSSLLVSDSRGYVISKDGTQVLVSELEGKMVGLYLSLHARQNCQDFTPKLIEVYKKLKEKGESFEIVWISLDNDEESFKQGLELVPWLALPFSDKLGDKLARYFELASLPTVVIIDTDGKTLNENVSDLIEEHGVEAYPFTPEKVAEFALMEKERLEAQTLESISVMGDADFVIEKDGSKVLVSELVGKTILLYFSAHWCPPCRMFTPQLIKVYHEIKATDKSFEVIFISSDRSQSSFDEYFLTMPWLALPFGDVRKKFLTQKFKLKGIPASVAISPNGRTITTKAQDLISTHGAAAYPFTEEHVKHLEEKLDEEAKKLPERLKHDLHPEHEIVRIKHVVVYVCDGCKEPGQGWAFRCKECDFDLHTKCAVKESEG